MGQVIPMTPVSTGYLKISTGDQTEMTDELLLLFGGRIYPPDVLRTARWDIDAALKTENICPSCRSLADCKMYAVGWQAFFDEAASDKYGYPQFRWARCGKQLQADAIQKEQAMIAKRFQLRSFETYQVTDENRAAFEKCKAYADNLTIMSTHGLMLVGPPGTGKTHLAASIARVALSKGITTGFVVVPKLLDEIREAVKSDTSMEIAGRVTDKRLVVLDDLGAEKITDWVRERLYTLINDRYERMLPTVVTSNCSIPELEQRLGKPTVDRLAEMCDVVPVTGRSWRRRRDS